MKRIQPKKTVVDGISFDSKLEARFYMEHKHLNLVPHPKLVFTHPITGKTITTYTPDFCWEEDGLIKYVDVKGDKKNERYKMIIQLWPHFMPKTHTLSTVRLCQGYWIPVLESEGTM